MIQITLNLQNKSTKAKEKEAKVSKSRASKCFVRLKTHFLALRVEISRHQKKTDQKSLQLRNKLLNTRSLRRNVYSLAGRIGRWRLIGSTTLVQLIERKKQFRKARTREMLQQQEKILNRSLIYPATGNLKTGWITPKSSSSRVTNEFLSLQAVLNEKKRMVA